MQRRGVALLVAGAVVLGACGTNDPADDATPGETAPESEPGTETESEPAPEAGADGGGPAAEADPEASPDMEPLGPPSDEIGAPVAIDPVLSEGDGVVVAFTGMTVFSEGMELLVAVRWDPDEGGRDPRGRPGGPMDAVDAQDPPASEDELPDDLLRIELLYPDGSVASSTDDVLATAAGEEPQEPALHPYRGMGGETAWNQQLWVHPLPAAGDQPLALDVSWPARGLDEQVDLDVDDGDLAEASDRVAVLWD